MASPQASEHLSSRLNAAIFDVDADYTTAAVVASTEIDMRDHSHVMYLAMSSTLTGAGISLLEIVGYTTTGGTGDITSLKTSGAVVCDAVGDYVMEEVSAEELRQEASDAGAQLRYVAVRLTATSWDAQG